MTKRIELKKGHLYRLVYKLQSGNYRWYKYEATMTFLDMDSRNGDTIWNLRPLAGTQTLAYDLILEAEDLGATQGRSDHRHRVKKSLGPIQKQETL